MTDLEFAEYEEFGGVLHCPYFEEDPSDLIDPYTEDDEYYDESPTLADFLEYEERQRKMREGHACVDDPGLDWPDENWPTISEYKINEKEN